jgi:hypothetical protein
MACGAAVLCVGAAPVAANPPTTTAVDTSFSVVVTDLCAFPVTISGTQSGTSRAFTDRRGVPTRTIFHTVEQDTFSAGGAVLRGLPFVNQQTLVFDGSGQLIHDYEVGVIERVPLPNGSTFLSAGRVDFVAHPDVSVLITPDVGHSGDLAGLCAALAP